MKNQPVTAGFHKSQATLTINGHTIFAHDRHIMVSKFFPSIAGFKVKYVPQKFAKENHMGCTRGIIKTNKLGDFLSIMHEYSRLVA